jgi:hypothetical protein
VILAGCFGKLSHPGGGGSGGTVIISATVVTGNGSIHASGGASESGCDSTFSGGGGAGGKVDARFAVMWSSVQMYAAGGPSDCGDARVARFCDDEVYVGLCKYKVMGDEFDDVMLQNPHWVWDNEPPPTCSQGTPELTVKDKLKLAGSNPHQGKCWDVGMSRNGWLRIVPQAGLTMWVNDTSHRLYYELPERTAFDVETRMQTRNNDTYCLAAGMFVRGPVVQPG